MTAAPTTTSSPFDTIPDANYREVTREMYERPVPCEVDWHERFHGQTNPKATHMAHFRCPYCNRQSPKLLCWDCTQDTTTDAAVQCEACAGISTCRESIIFTTPIGLD